MGYADQFVQEVSYFSNPDLSYEGVPLGKDTSPMSDNAGVIRSISANIVKNYFSAPAITVTVDNGLGGGDFTPGSTIEISAAASPSGQIFSHWSSSNGGTFLDENSANTSFTVPEEATTLIAHYAYTLNSIDRLISLSESPDEWDSLFVITGDIDASSTASLNSGLGFSPIGNETKKFTGTFSNPRNYKIRNLFINNSNSEAAFFGSVQNAKISGVYLEDVNVTSSGKSAGLIGVAYEGTELDSCYVSGTVSSTGDYAGGLIALSYGTTITDCATDIS